MPEIGLQEEKTSVPQPTIYSNVTYRDNYSTSHQETVCARPNNQKKLGEILILLF